MEECATKLDMLQMKIDINKEQEKIRHDKNNWFWEKLFQLDELTIKHELLNQSMWNMNEKITSIETKLDTLIEKLESKFAAKWVEKSAIFVITKVAWIIIVSLMYLIIKMKWNI